MSSGRKQIGSDCDSTSIRYPARIRPFNRSSLPIGGVRRKVAIFLDLCEVEDRSAFGLSGGGSEAAPKAREAKVVAVQARDELIDRAGIRKFPRKTVN